MRGGFGTHRHGRRARRLDESSVVLTALKFGKASIKNSPDKSSAPARGHAAVVGEGAEQGLAAVDDRPVCDRQRTGGEGMNRRAAIRRMTSFFLTTASLYRRV